MKLIDVAALIEGNGKSVRQNNLEIGHGIPLGSLVEIMPTEWDLEDPENMPSYVGLRLYVVEHSRDCDGTPLYSISFKPNAFTALTKYKTLIDNKDYDPSDPYSESVIKALYWKFLGSIETGFNEAALKVIR